MSNKLKPNGQLEVKPVVSKKDRRHSGWIYPYSTLRCSNKFILEHCLEPEPYWDDWKEYRDGFRNYRTDWKKIISLPNLPCCDNNFPSEKERVIDRLTGNKRDICWCYYRIKANKHQKKLLLIRKARKLKLKSNKFFYFTI